MKGKHVFQRFVFAVMIFAALAGIVSAQDDAKMLYFPALNEDGEKAEISLTNNGDIDDAVIIRAYDEKGAQLDMLVRTLEAGETDKVDVKDMPEDTATVTVEFNGDVSGNIIDTQHSSSRKAMRASSTPEKTKTGFYYPTGEGSYYIYPCGKWLGRDKANGGCYFDGKYHIGADIKANLDSPVYPISDGVITRISTDGWGTGNVAAIVKHKLSDGTEFLSLYGHIKTSLKAGDQVKGGVGFAKIGYWSNGNHLHFGIHPSLTLSGNLGAMPNSSWPSTNGFAEPISWITTKTPDGGLSVYDFWKKADPIYADSSGNTQNFDAQYEVKNSGSKSITIERLALAIHKDGGVWDLCYPNTRTPRYYDNVVLNSGGTKHFEFSVGYMKSPGTYQLIAKAKMNGEWKHLATQEFTVLNGNQVKYYKISPKCSGKCLDVAGGSKDNGAKILQRFCNGTVMAEIISYGNLNQKATAITVSAQNTAANVLMWKEEAKIAVQKFCNGAVMGETTNYGKWNLPVTVITSSLQNTAANALM